MPASFSNALTKFTRTSNIKIPSTTRSASRHDSLSSINENLTYLNISIIYYKNKCYINNITGKTIAVYISNAIIIAFQNFLKSP